MSAIQPTPDLFLARRAAAGQARAWDEIIERFGRKIYNLAFQFAGSREDAEDLTQEIFVRLYRSLAAYRGEAPLVAWTMRLSRNLCIDHYRRHRTERRSEFVSEEVLEQLAAEGDPERDALARKRVELVYRCLDELPREQAEMVLLRDLQGWSERETAIALEIPEGTAKSRLFRARRALAERLEAAVGSQEASRA